MISLVTHYLFSIFIISTLVDLQSFYSIKPNIISFCGAENIRGNDLNDLMITSVEMAALELFKSRVTSLLTEDFMRDDFYLLRWLRVTELDISQAENLLIQNLRWREANNINEILFEDFSDVTGILPATYDTHDKMKRPVLAISLGSWNFLAAAIQGNIQRAHRYFDFLFENVIHEILDAHAAGLNISRAMVLVDLEGLNLLSATGMSILFRMQPTLESYYPQFWEEIILINAPMGSNLLWMSIHPLFSKETQAIFRIFDAKQSIWQAYLDDRIDEDQRYKNFGGNKEFII